MIYKATTETGSIYIIDTVNKTWRKERMPTIQGAHPLRSQSGVYSDIGPIAVGASIRMLGKPLDKRQDFRLIETSWVVQLEETSN